MVARFVWGSRISDIRYQRSGTKRRGSNGAMIPPLRNGKRRRCYGRDDSMEKGPTRLKAALRFQRKRGEEQGKEGR